MYGTRPSRLLEQSELVERRWTSWDSRHVKTVTLKCKWWRNLMIEGFCYLEWRSVEGNMVHKRCKWSTPFFNSWVVSWSATFSFIIFFCFRLSTQQSSLQACPVAWRQRIQVQNEKKTLIRKILTFLYFLNVWGCSEDACGLGAGIPFP